MRPRHPDSRTFLCFCSLRGPIEEQASKLFVCGRRQANRSQLLAGALVLRTYLSDHCAIDLGISYDKLLEVSFANECYLSRLENFRGDFMNAAGHHRGQAKHIPRFGDSQDQRLASTRTESQLDLTRTQQQQAAGLFILNKQDGSRRI